MQDNLHKGSTRLHKDLTDAVNIMLWAATPAGGIPGSALWHIFPAAVSHVLSKFLREQGFVDPGDPIHSQIIYMTPAMLELLFQQYGIRPWTITQRPDEAVYIPAGCPHQVRPFFDSSHCQLNGVRDEHR
jgi:lysine-specific demethylase 3